MLHSAVNERVNVMGETRTSGVAESVTAYMTANADRPVTVNELLANAPRNASRSAVCTGTVRLHEKFPDRMQRVSKGVWIWNSDGVAPEITPTKAPALVMVRILKMRDDGEFLAIDDETDNLYTVRPLVW